MKSSHSHDNAICSIYQIYFSAQQLPLLEKEFIPYDNSESLHPEQREYAVFKKKFEEEFHKKSKLTGMLSWKFREKAGITGAQFIQFIEQNPGYDVYYINPFPHEHKFLSVWEQAEHCHPGIIELAQFIFNHVNDSIRLKDIRNVSINAAYCNFWVGTENFWEAYMAFTLPIYHYMLHDAPMEIKNKLFTKADKMTDSVFFPFIMERLFSTFLCQNNTIKALKYPYPESLLEKKYSKEWVNHIMGLHYFDEKNYLKARQYLTSTMVSDPYLRTSLMRRLIKKGIRLIKKCVGLS